MKLKLGVIINPMAGIGGAVGLKGSDAVAADAFARGAVPRAGERATTALATLVPQAGQLECYCFGGDMGESVLARVGLPYRVLGTAAAPSSAEDTVAAARCMRDAGVDLLVFAGGDGTARDMVTAVGTDIPVLGIPAGVKMHSGVYAVSPQAAGELLQRLVAGGLVDVGLCEVRDIDEQAFRQGQVRARFYGELLVPRSGGFLQQVKSSGREVEELVIQDIGAELVESMAPDCLYLVGPGTTPSGFMQELGLDNTLLGVDAVYNSELLASDINEQQILGLLQQYPNARIVVTAIGGQGHILGRGNQQLSPAVIRRVGAEHLIIVASKTKITGLAGRPLLVDTGDPELDQQLQGYRRVITGYHDAIVYAVGDAPSAQPA